MTSHRVSPSPSPVCSETHAATPQIQNGRRCCSQNLRWTDAVQAHVWPPHPFPHFHSHSYPSTTGPRSSISPRSHHNHLLSNQTRCGESASGMKSLLTLTGFDPRDERLNFRASVGSLVTYTLHYTRYCNISSAVNSSFLCTLP